MRNQTAVLIMNGAVTKGAVFAALNRHFVVISVRILIADFFVQILHKLGGAVIEPVDIFVKAIFAVIHLAVEIAALGAGGFRPMVLCIVGINARLAAVHVAFGHPVHHSAVGIFNITG